MCIANVVSSQFSTSDELLDLLFLESTISFSLTPKRTYPGKTSVRVMT